MTLQPPALNRPLLNPGTDVPDSEERRLFTVLVVDDFAPNRFMFEGWLRHSYRVLLANNGIEALKITEQEMPDLILLDLVMPEMDGQETCLHLKSQARTRDIPIIFVTSERSFEQEALCLSWGAADFISKPVHPAVLRARVQTQLELKAASERLKVKTEKLALAADVFNHARDSIVILDRDRRILEINQTFTRTSGFTPDDVQGQTLDLIRSDQHDEMFHLAIWQAMAEEGHWSGEIWSRHKTGSVHPEWASFSAVYGDNGEVKNYIAVLSDISSLKDKQYLLEHIAHHDVLTDLPNRVLLADRLKQAIEVCDRKQIGLAVAFVDLDGFKGINDRYGHQTGDQVLVQAANRMDEALRAGDTLARIGGDEFVAVISELQDEATCLPVLERLLKAVSRPIEVEGNMLQLTASIGVALYPQARVDADQLLRQADQAMYLAKQQGKNRFHFFDVAGDSHARAQITSIRDIREGLVLEQFELHYQPKVSMKEGRVTGFEALIRWRHPDKGLLAPGSFLPMVEGDPLSIEIDDWVMARALAQMEEWHGFGIELPVSVNVSAATLQQSDFVGRLRELLRQHPQVPPHRLSIEIVETSTLGDLSRVSRIMQDCMQFGVGFALDDFGTGYSSLTYLKYLPAQLLKIDQSFVRDMPRNPYDLSIVKGVIGLAQAFRREVIAEGVETIEDGERLLRLGCQFAQGYGIAKPMPADAVAPWLDSWTAPASWKKQIYIPRDPVMLLDQLIQPAPVGIAVIDRDGFFQAVNSAYCAIYGYRQDELLGRNFTILLPETSHSNVLDLHYRFISEDSELKGDWTVRRRDGSILKVHSDSVRVPWTGDLPHRLVYVHEVIERPQTPTQS